jgi:signal transduction histidine kinase/ActR/RegA family two-component response regulator
MIPLEPSLFKRALFRAVVLQPFFLALLAGVLLWKIDRVLSVFGWSNPLSPVIEQAHKVRELLVNMEFALRGFLTSADVDLFARYHESAAMTPDALRELESRIALNALPGQERALAVLEVTYPAWQRTADELIVAKQCRDETAGSALYAAQLLDSMKNSIRLLVGSEFDLQAERLSDRREAGRLAVAFALLSTLVVGLALSLVARRQLLAVSRSYEQALGDQKRKTGELRDAQSRAEQASRAKDEFLATISHELRTPLNAILTAAHVLKAPALEPSRAHRALELIDRNVKHQARLIEDLLDVSRIVSGKWVLDATVLDLGLVVSEAAQGARPFAEASQLALDISIPEERLAVLGDHGRLLQVFSNVLANAVKFTPPGGRIAISLARDERDAEIRVEDTGIGIAAAVLPRIFDRFEQADGSTTRKHGGLGLGLAIAQHLVMVHRGSIWAESPGENRGTTVRIRLPLHGDTALPALPPASQRLDERGGSELRPLHGLRLMVVDDDRDAREALAMLLSIHGASVVAVGSVSEALARLDDFRADLVLADIAMPDEDGYELLRRLHSRDADREHPTPAIAVTAMAAAADRARVINAGFAVHITKPIDAADLIRVVIMTIAANRSGAWRDLMAQE